MSSITALPLIRDRAVTHLAADAVQLPKILPATFLQELLGTDEMK
jgi:hypothetical protein